MKAFGWRQHAVQGVVIDGKNPGRYGEEEMLRRYGQDTSRPALTTRRNSKPKTSLYLSSSKLDSQPDVWSDDFVPESPPPLHVTGFDDTFSDVPIAPVEFTLGQLGKSHSSKSLKSYSKNATRSTVTAVPAHTLEFLKSRNSSTSTIFQDPQNPITIVLTTPEDELPGPLFYEPSPSDTNGTRPRNSSVSSLPVLPSQKPNPHLLMPPLDTQHDPRTLRKAQEFREIRKWLISFLNAKGDTFPRKLRRRMMEIYSIKPTDLSPSILRKWELENEDEGVSLFDGKLDGKDEEMDQKESLRILGQAMRSRIEEVTPLPPKKAKPKPKSPPRSPPRVRPQSRKGSVTANAQPLATILDDEELPPTWLGPLISTSSSSRDSILLNESYLKRAYSAPDLHGKKSSRPAQVPQTQSAPILRAGLSGSVAEMEKLKAQARQNRRSILSGVFGSVREAFGGRPKSAANVKVR